MNLRKLTVSLATIGVMGAMVAAPVSSFAQDWGYSYAQHRQDQQNQWRNLAIGSAAVGVLGLLTHNDTMSVLGLGGAAYSGYRLSQDGRNDWRYGYNTGDNCAPAYGYAAPAYGYTNVNIGGYSNYGRRDIRAGRERSDRGRRERRRY